jgi:hypothetical protein
LQKDFITAGVQLIGAHFVPPRVGNLYHFPGASRKCMFSRFLVLEHAELFISERVAGNAIAMEHAGVRR